MKKYIGTKLVQARPMTRGAYTDTVGGKTRRMKTRKMKDT